MKIAYVVPGGVDRSGTPRVIPHLLERLRRLTGHHEVHVFVLSHEPTPGRWTVEGALLHNIGTRPRRVQCLRAMWREHARGRFDVIHALFLVPQAVVGALAGRVLTVPVVVEAPGGDFVSMPDIEWGGWHRWQGRAWIRLAMSMTARLIVPSEAARGQARDRGYEAEVLAWGTARESWPKTEPRARGVGDPLRIAWVGSLNRVKDPGTMLGTAAALRERGLGFTLDVFGEDTLGGAVQTEATVRHLVGQVRFHGYVPQADLRNRICEADLLLVTSRFEGGPRVVLEAAMCGVPTVGTDVGLLRELGVEAAKTVPVGNANALAAAVWALASDDATRMRVARAAQEWACRRDVDTCVAGLHRIYEDVIEKVASTATARE